jgi:formate-dependent nitrite reductase membrane component NrfD
LLGASNQPVWSNTTWTGALFLASAGSTGAAAIVLIDRWFRLDAPEEALERLERLDSWAIGFELVLLAALFLSLGRVGMSALRSWPGLLLVGFVVPVGLLAPLFLRRGRGARLAELASLLVLLGGLALRAAIVGMAAPLLAVRPE